MSLHADARAVLASWVAPDPAQERLRRAYLDHLDRYPDAMWRSCLSGHLTASTAVVDSTGQRVLLTLHRKIRLWLQLGGHCEPGDSSLAAAALREATEESGSRASACSPLRCGWTGMRCPCGGGSWHLDVQYVAVAPPGAEPVVDAAESDGLAWFDVTALPEMSDDACRALVAAAVQRVSTMVEAG